MAARTTRTGTSISAVKAEVKESEVLETKTVEFEFDGDTYTVDPKDLEDLDFLEAYEDGKVLVPVRSLLGPKQWAKFREEHHDATALAEMADAMFSKLGTDAGE